MHLIKAEVVSSAQQAFTGFSSFPSSVVRLNAVKQELNFHDKDTQFYRFRESECSLNHVTNDRDVEEDLQEGLSLLSQLGPDALLTMILRKW